MLPGVVRLTLTVTLAFQMYIHDHHRCETQYADSEHDVTHNLHGAGSPRASVKAAVRGVYSVECKEARFMMDNDAMLCDTLPYVLIMHYVMLCNACCAVLCCVVLL